MKSRIASQDFSRFFDVNIVEHSYYNENTTKGFIIRSLMNEKRPDNFVTASIYPKKIQNTKLQALMGGFSSIYGKPSPEDWILDLNCSLSRVQIKVILTPKFISLDQIVMVISCAPSLTNLYIFELSTQHIRRDWGVFEGNGKELERHWYRLKWNRELQWLVDAVCKRLLDAVHAHLEQATKKISETK